MLTALGWLRYLDDGASNSIESGSTPVTRWHSHCTTKDGLEWHFRKGCRTPLDVLLIPARPIASNETAGNLFKRSTAMVVTAAGFVGSTIRLNKLTGMRFRSTREAFRAANKLADSVGIEQRVWLAIEFANGANYFYGPRFSA